MANNRAVTVPDAPRALSLSRPEARAELLAAHRAVAALIADMMRRRWASDAERAWRTVLLDHANSRLERALEAAK